MSLQPIIFLLLFGGIQGLLFTAFLLRRKLYRHGYIFLMFYIGTMLLQLTLKVMNKAWLMENWSILYSLGHFLPFLYGPFLLLFVQEKLLNQKPGRKAWMHFLPFIIMMGVLILEKFAPLPYWIELVVYNPYLRFLLLMASVTGYHAKALTIWKNKLSQPGARDIALAEDAWLYQFIRSSFIVTAIIVIALYLLYLNYPAGHGYRYGFLALTCFIYWITWSSLKQPLLFSESGSAHPHPVPALFVHRRIRKYANSTLDDTEKQRIASILKQCMEEEKAYLDPALTIDQLAGKIQCSRHSLSQVLNESLGKSFYDFTNHYRVNAAKQMLLSPAGKQYKIASIAYDAGFNSLSTFNEVFRKMTGCTPSEYSKELKVRQRV